MSRPGRSWGFLFSGPPAPRRLLPTRGRRRADSTQRLSGGKEQNCKGWGRANEIYGSCRASSSTERRPQRWPGDFTRTLFLAS